MKPDNDGYDMGEKARADRRRRQQAQLDEHKDAQRARDRMIKRLSTDKENAKTDESTSGTDRIPLWSR